ncbi:GAF domain-containing protein [Egibacter rhizosphaerae]|uniref:GAF domain-containing protein n=1 Tax=Egibacter rhizosphaerae TaxID=1670831 RepID=A0A411YAV8_9ACTN|nr:GAF domain-containing protein [Egibacter rhizosphaerae]QBI18341.1 GAF domain-containing protein [Egibacter rhizosphaerae]
MAAEGAITDDGPARADSGRARALLTRLQRLTLQLGQALSVEDVLEVMVTTVGEELAADFVSVWLLEGPDPRTLRRVRDVGVPSDVMADWDAVADDERWPLAWALHHHELVEWSDREERRTRFPAVPEDSIRHEAHLVAPLAVQGRDLGGIVFGFAEPRTFDPEQREFMRAVAGQCAQALHRAHLHERLTTERERAEFRAGVGQVLVRSLDEQQLIKQLAEMAGPSLADACVIATVGEEGQLHPVASAHRDPTKRALLDQLVALQEPVRNPYLLKAIEAGEAVVLPTVHPHTLDDVTLSAEHRELLDRFGATSAIAAPLRAHDETHGVLVVVNTSEDRQLTDEDVSLVDSVASQAALAISNARAHGHVRELSEQLEGALDSRVVIEQAKGVLAERYGEDPETAFDRLRHAARSSHESIHVTAEAVLAGRVRP